MTYIRKLITIRPDQAEWIEENCINLSRFVQKCIDRKVKDESHQS